MKNFNIHILGGHNSAPKFTDDSLTKAPQAPQKKPHKILVSE